MKRWVVLIAIILTLGIVQYSIAQTSYQTIQLRRDTTSAWSAANPILSSGEPGYNTTLKKLKIGDGVSHWADLDYSTYTLAELEAIAPTFRYSILRTGDNVALLGDVDSPGNSKFYGTNDSGTKVWCGFTNSITQSGVNVKLVNDSASPGNNKYYGTDASGTKGFQNGIPAGFMGPYGGTTAPSGWLMCDGTAVSRTTYADLFTAIGTAYGVGNGSTTFNLPNLQGRVPVGKNSGTFVTLGATGGEETHTLTATEMPAHTHGLGIVWTSGEGASNGVTINTPVGGSALISQSTGGGLAHNNLQPYQVVNYIIRY